jgi:hypothetical protein
VISGATVTVTSLATGQQRVVKTDASGLYTFSVLPTGNYKMRFDAANFKPVEIASVTVIVGSYLVILTSSPGVPLWVGWVEFLASEVIAIGILGYPLLKAVDRATRRNAIPTAP